MDRAEPAGSHDLGDGARRTVLNELRSVLFGMAPIAAFAVWRQMTSRPTVGVLSIGYGATIRSLPVVVANVVVAVVAVYSSLRPLTPVAAVPPALPASAPSDDAG